MEHRDPLENDLLLRPLSSYHGKPQYIILSALTLKPAAGPFESFYEARLAARDLAALRGVAVWQEHLDRHGDLVGRPVLLFQGRI